MSTAASLNFYDYLQDPDALNNLIDSSEHQTLIAEFKAKLLAEMIDTNDGQLDNYKAAIGK